MLINHMSREQLPHTMIVASNTYRSPKKQRKGKKESTCILRVTQEKRGDAYGKRAKLLTCIGPSIGNGMRSHRLS